MPDAMHKAVAAAIAILLAMSPLSASPSLAQTAQPRTLEGSIVTIAANKASLTVAPLVTPHHLTVQVPKDLQPALAAMKTGDAVVLTYVEEKGTKTLRSLTAKVEIKGAIVSITDDKAFLVLTPKGKTEQVAVEVPKELQTALKDFGQGDRVVLQVLEGPDTRTLKFMRPQEIEVNRWCRVALLGFVAVVLLIFTAIVIRGNPLNLIIGLDDRYSTSQFQMAIWFWVLVTTYVATEYLRGFLGGAEFVGRVSIPDNLLMLSGLSAFTFAAARGITAKKAEQAAKAAQAVPQQPPQGAGAQQPAEPLLKKKSPTGPRFLDLVQNDERKADLGDFQMLILTLLAVGVYSVEVFKFLGAVPLLNVVALPDVDSTILATFGLGQGAYLVKKGAGNVGQS